MRIMRVFIKPAGTSWVDFPMAENTTTMQQVLPAVRLDGMFIQDTAAIPWDGMLFAAMLDMPDNARPTMAFPSGKLN